MVTFLFKLLLLRAGNPHCLDGLFSNRACAPGLSGVSSGFPLAQLWAWMSSWGDGGSDRGRSGAGRLQGPAGVPQPSVLLAGSLSSTSAERCCCLSEAALWCTQYTLSWRCWNEKLPFLGNKWLFILFIPAIPYKTKTGKHMLRMTFCYKYCSQMMAPSACWVRSRVLTYT